ncbi:hypothetical protein A4G99_13060 [Haladaptatus sp. R4]|nr:hypothetical protein A4G99_13060 [Haladaptatus sp. R4]
MYFTFRKERFHVSRNLSELRTVGSARLYRNGAETPLRPTTTNGRAPWRNSPELVGFLPLHLSCPINE